MSLVKPKKIERERDGASAASATASESQLEVPARSERNEDLTSSKIKKHGLASACTMSITTQSSYIVISPKMSDNKLVKILTDAATITGIAAGYGWIAKKVVKEPMTSDPSVNLMNYVKFTVVVAASIATKRYLEDQKILPS